MFINTVYKYIFLQHVFSNDPNASILLAWADKNILVVTFNYIGSPEGYLSKNRGKYV